MSEVLVRCLDSIDAHLLDSFDEAEDLRPDVVKRLRYCTSALLEGSIPRRPWPRTGRTGST